MRNLRRGMTLLELLIVLVVVGVLASLAPPDGVGIGARSVDGRYALAIESADATGERSATNRAGGAAPRCWQ